MMTENVEKVVVWAIGVGTVLLIVGGLYVACADVGRSHADLSVECYESPKKMMEVTRQKCAVYLLQQLHQSREPMAEFCAKDPRNMYESDVQRCLLFYQQRAQTERQ